MKNPSHDIPNRIRIVISGSFLAFRRNNDLTAASSLAFSATLALIPSLFLLTFLLGAAIGSSGRALARTQELLAEFMPAYSQDIVREVQFISSHAGTIGLLNGLVLLWSATPLVSDIRMALGAVFRKKRARPFLLEKLFDLAIGIVFLTGLSAISVAGFVFTLAQKRTHFQFSDGYLEWTVQFLFIVLAVFSLYVVFSRRSNLLHLVTGSFVASLLWFGIRPAFHLFLMYNPGYGLAFGSFKSLFVVIIWIYFSFVVFLFGAEVAASLGRDETAFLKHLMEGKRNVPSGIIDRYVLKFEREGVIFREGDPGNEMFSVLTGSVSIRKDGKEIAVVLPGKCFGGMSFLLSSPRVATAVALEAVELVAVSNENINNLMNEYPEFVVEILREMAQGLREKNVTID